MHIHRVLKEREGKYVIFVRFIEVFVDNHIGASSAEWLVYTDKRQECL